MRLPNGYTELEYIYSNGTQYINTEFTPNAKSKIEMRIAITDYSVNSCFFCARNEKSDTDAKSFTAFYIKAASNAAGSYRFDFFGESKSSSSTETVNTITDVKAENGILTIGSITLNVTPKTLSCNMPWILLASTSSSEINTVTNAAKAKLYSCRIYDNGILIRNFIPCINEENEIGLYDFVNSKFYGNAGTGVFIPGPSRVALPSGYTQLEYIESTGTQYVDTGFNITSINYQNLKMSIICEKIGQGTSANTWLIDGSSTTNAYFYMGVYNGKYYYGYGTSDHDTGIAAGSGKKVYILDIPLKKFSVSNEVDVSITIGKVTSSGPIMLFGFSYSGIRSYAEKVYSCQIYDNGVLTRNFVPCKNPSGAIGLYDLVNSKFYGNAGTGIFTAGPEVIWPSNDAIYVKINDIWKKINGIKIL